MPHLGVTAAANALKLSASTVSRYVAKHPELNHARPGAPRPLIDVEEYRVHAAENVNRAMSGNHAGVLFDGEEETTTESRAQPNERRSQGGVTYSRAKAAREGILAQEARIRLDEKLGTLVPRREVEDAAFEVAQTMQKELLQLGHNLADRLAVMNDPREIATLIETEHRRVLENMADAMSLREEAYAAA